MRSVLAMVNRYVPRGSAILAGTTFLSYALGLVRDRLFAQTFGAGTSLDSYNAAFLVPDFIFNVLVASGIAAAAVPLFMELQRRNKSEAYAYMSSLLSVAVASMVVVALIIAVFAPSLSSLVAPGLPHESQALVAHLMRILALSPILFAASNALGALLVAERRFFCYGLSPVLYNVGIIVGTLFLAPTWGVVGVAWGTVLGALLHLLTRFAEVWWVGERLRFSWRMAPSLWRRTLTLMAPKMIGHPVELVTFWVFTSLASHLAVGSITTLNFARNFQSVPVSLLGIAMATAVFPALSEAALASKIQLLALVRRTAVLIMAVSALAAVVLFVIRYPLIQLLLGGGKFDDDAVARTALVLGVFCLSIPTESVSHLLARAFYATQHTLTPVLLGVLNLGIAGGLAFLLMDEMGIVALPLAYFMGSLLKTGGLYFLLQRRMSSAQGGVSQR